MQTKLIQDKFCEYLHTCDTQEIQNHKHIYSNIQAILPVQFN